MNKVTILTSGHSRRQRQIKKSTRYIRRRRKITMTITIPAECPVCGTLFDQEEYEVCPHCEDNEFDPYSVFQDVEKEYPLR